jgi:hypothetical protein
MEVMMAEKIRLRFCRGDCVVLWMAPNKKALQAMARRKPPDSWSRAAKRILKRLDGWGLGVAEVAREVNAKSGLGRRRREGK